MKANKLLYCFTFSSVILFAAGILIFQRDVGNEVRNSLSICAFSVIPSLFPFLVLSKLTTNLRFFEKLELFSRKIMFPLFSLGHNCTPALILGITGGYPVGAMTAASLYRDGLCTKKEAERLLVFSNNCGPAFIIATIGYEIFGSSSSGVVLYIIHILSALLCGIVFRIVSPLESVSHIASQHKSNRTIDFSFAFTDAVYNALRASLLISAYIVLFSSILIILKKTMLLYLLSMPVSAITRTDVSTAEAFISGLLEVTKGSYLLSEVASPKLLFVLISTLLGWGGFSVHAQTLGCISDYDLSTKPYFLGKILHGTLSLILSSVTLLFFNPCAVETFSPNVLSSHREYTPIFTIVGIMLIFIFCKKGWKKAK